MPAFDLTSYEGILTMDIGTGIAITGTVVATAAIIIKWLSRESVSRPCMTHAKMEQQIKSMEDWLGKVEAKLDKVIERAIG